MRHRQPIRDAFSACADASPGYTPLSHRWRDVLCLGIGVLVLGMYAMPSGPSFNPSQPYQYLVGIALYLPALIVGFVHPSRWLAWVRQPLMPLLLLLFMWAAVTLSWTNAVRPVDEALRMLSILVFLFAWHHGIGRDSQRLRTLLVVCAGTMAIIAIICGVRYVLHPPADMRLTGFGVMASANLMAACLATAVLWLAPWPTHTALLRGLKWSGIAVLLICLLLTRSRSVMLALFVALMALSFVEPRHSGLRPAALTAIALACMAVFHPLLMQRGWSLRPEILAYSWDLFLQHPWTGLGLGARFTIPTSEFSQTHTHNLFAQLAVELGIPGVLLWTLLWLALGYRAWRQSAHTTGRLILSLWVLASVAVQFDLPHLIDSPRPGWLFLWFPLAMSLSLPPRDRHAANEDLVDRPDLQLATGAATGSGNHRSADTQARRDRDRR